MRHQQTGLFIARLSDPSLPVSFSAAYALASISFGNGSASACGLRLQIGSIDGEDPCGLNKIKGLLGDLELERRNEPHWQRNTLRLLLRV